MYSFSPLQLSGSGGGHGGSSTPVQAKPRPILVDTSLCGSSGPPSPATPKTAGSGHNNSAFHYTSSLKHHFPAKRPMIKKRVTLR